MTTLNWGYCQGNKWCSFRTLTLDEDLNSMYGVYVIWREEHGVVFEAYVGEGIIGERISKHRREFAFNYFTKHDSFVTWAQVPNSNKELGRKIEQYLINSLPNTMNYKEVRPQESVNKPWDNLPWKL